MALPSSGIIYFSQMRTELGLSGTYNIGSAASRGLAGIPSGIIKSSNFYGKSSGPVLIADVNMPCVYDTDNYDEWLGYGYSNGGAVVFTGPVLRNAYSTGTYNSAPASKSSYAYWNSVLTGTPISILLSIDNGTQYRFDTSITTDKGKSYSLSGGQVFNFPQSGTHRLRASAMPVQTLVHSGVMTVGYKASYQYGYQAGVVGSYSLTSGAAIDAFYYWNFNPYTDIVFSLGTGPFSYNITISVSGYTPTVFTHNGGRTYRAAGNPFNLYTAQGQTRTITSIVNS